MPKIRRQANLLHWHQYWDLRCIHNLNKMKTLLLFAFGVFATTAIHAQDFDYSFKETYEVNGQAQLDLSSFDGNLDVIPSSGNKIEVFYIVKKSGRLLKIDRKALEEELVVESEHSDNRVRIHVKNKNQNLGFNSFKNIPNVHFKAYVPKQTSCRLVTSDGSISVVGLNSNQECRTSDGSIEVSEISGNVMAKTSDGDVRARQITGVMEIRTSDGNIELKRIIGDVQASTSDGNIILDRVKGEISVKTSDGYVDFEEISGSLRASTSDGNIKGNVIDLKDALTLKTSGGNIDVGLPAQLGIDFEIKAEAIDVPFKNFTGKFDKTFVSGKSNGGGIPVVLSTSDGSVTVTY
jgi:DUF4097 and DUF4098 domain-containing protein YvlB